MRPDTRAFYTMAVQRVVSHLTDRLDESADLRSLASLAGLSPFHFHRVFRGMVGETPLELLRRLRLERAACTLRDTTDPVTRIAFAAGYETHEAFTRAFRAAFGASPSEFRRRGGVSAVLSAPSGVHYRGGRVHALFTPRDTGGHTMQIEIEQLPALRLATVSHVGAYNTIGTAFETLGRLAGQAGLFGHPDVMMIAAYWDDPDAVARDELRASAGITVPDGVPLPAGLEEVRIAGGPYAKFVHVGPYDALDSVWPRFMGEGLPASGYLVGDGPALEIYRSDMRTTPPAENRTDLLVPVSA